MITFTPFDFYFDTLDRHGPILYISRMILTNLEQLMGLTMIDGEQMS